MILYDAKTGQPIDLDSASAQAALVAGTHIFKPGEEVIVRNKAGEAYAFPAEQAAIEITKHGASLEDEAQAAGRLQQEEYGDYEGTAAVMGGLRGATLGMSDVVASKLGFAEQVRGIKQASPSASMGGEVVGAVGSLLVPGGQAKILQGARALGAPARATAKVGQMVERGLGKALKVGTQETALGRVAAKSVQMGGAAAVEGGLYGAGQFVSEAALGEIDPNAEALLGHVGTGAVLGGVFGGGLGALGGIGGEVVSGGKGLFDKARKGFVKKTATQEGSDVAEMSMRLDGAVPEQEAQSVLAETYAKMSAATTGAEKQAILDAMSPRGRKIIQESAGKHERLAREMATLQDGMDDIADEIIHAGVGGAKKRNWRDMSEGGDSAALGESLLGAGPDGVGAMTTAINRLDEMTGKGSKGVYEYQGTLRKLRDNAKAAENKMMKIAARGGDDVTGQIAAVADDFKRQVGNARAKMGRAREMGPAQLETMGEIENLYMPLREILEDSNLVGKSISAAQKDVNAAWSRHLGRKGFQRKYTTSRKWGTGDFGKAGPGKDAIYRADAGGIESLLRDTGRQNKVAMDLEYINHQMSTRADVLDSMSRHYDMPEGIAGKIDAYKVKSDRIRKIIGEATETSRLQAQIKDLADAGSKTGLDMSSGMVIGGFLGGAPGAAIGATLSAVLNPANTVRKVATLDRILKRFNTRISGAIGSYVRKAKKAGPTIRRAVAPASVGALGRSEIAPKRKGESRGERFRSIRRELETLSGDAVRSEDRLVRATATVADVAPRLAQAMQIKAVNSAQYLLSKAPVPPAWMSPFKSDKWGPSDVDLDRFEKILAAVEHPESVLKDLNNGTLTKAAVDALEATSPEMYARIVGELQDRLADLREELPYEDRLQLSVLFPVAVEPSAAPAMVAAWQAGYAQPPPQEQIPVPSQKSIESIDPSAMMTTAQRLEANKR